MGSFLNALLHFPLGILIVSLHNLWLDAAYSEQHSYSSCNRWCPKAKVRFLSLRANKDGKRSAIPLYRNAE